jgi:glucosamine--fructose-6-phosphate aminotransferase (isomerizing)
VIGAASLADIVGQGSGWTAAVDAVARVSSAASELIRGVAPRHIVVTGCGSPYFLALTTAHLLADNESRAIVGAIPASELVAAPALLVPSPASTLLVAISRSGSTTEVVQAVDAFRRHGGAGVVAITCRSGAELTHRADVVIGIDEGYEESIAQTRSFSSMLVAAEQLAASWGHGAMASPSPAGELERAEQAVASCGSLDRFERVDFLGSGALYGLACEAMLKMSEMALTHSGAFGVLEYRHGPKAMVDERTLVVGITGGTSLATERPVLAEVSELGCHVLEVPHIPGRSRATVMPTLQLLAHHRAVARGVDPDVPRHLSVVVHLDDGLQFTRTTTTSRGI